MSPWPWPEGPQNPPLPKSQVHVWLADFNHPAGALGPAGTAEPVLDGLSPEEIERARKARSPAFRAEFIRTRQTLRQLLGKYLQVSPADIALRANEHGKLSLAPPFDNALQFNLSHAAGIALYVFAVGREVGVDLDRLDRIADWQGVAKRTFSVREQEALRDLPEAERSAAFMRGWIRKEAFAKARGAGFQYGFSRFTVSLADHRENSLLLEDSRDETASQKWGLRELEVPPPLAAAVAIECPATGIICWQLKR